MLLSAVLFVATIYSATAIYPDSPGSGYCRFITCPDSILSCDNPLPPAPEYGRCCPRCPIGQTCSIQGQVFQQCMSCPVTCANRDQIIPCPLICRPGCGCPPGTVIDEINQKCVNPESCPSTPTCPIEGQVFQRCKSCPVTCSNRDQQIPCPLICRPGCGCPPGTVIDEINQKCVNPESCPSTPTCPIEGQVFQRCKSCPVTCANRDQQIPCPEICRPGCGCPPGTVIDEINQKCVNPESCPSTPTCPIEGQVFQRCKSCPVTCANRDQQIPCPLICRPGCGCPPGTVIDEINQKCVKAESCPSTPTCPIEGQVFQRCRSCPVTCEVPDIACITICEPGCGCPPRQLIDEQNNKCVARDQCPSNNGNKCKLPRDPGPCRAAIPRYFYNTNTQRCERFIYGGCSGNDNNFRTIRDCLRQCSSTSSNPTRTCRLPRDPGPCEAAIPRYFYNTNTQRCERFIYGGCRGNDNNFRTIRDCLRQCSSTSSNPTATCKLPRDPGPCLAAITRFFYNTNTQRCERFIYGGCRGNANNFESLRDCEARCKTGSTNPRYPVCSRNYCASRPDRICTVPVNTLGRSRCDVTICRACYYSPRPLPLSRLNRQCPQVIPLTNGNNSCGNNRILKSWGYCVHKAYKRRHRNHQSIYGRFRCWRPPY